MALGDGIRRNIASVDPAERALLRDAMVALGSRYFPGSRADAIPGGVSWWFKQDEIHQNTHVHQGPEFLPWHREIVNRLEEMLRQINPLLSLHYWDWTQDPRAIPNANLGSGNIGTLDLFTTDFMGHGGSNVAPIGEPWLSAGYYQPGAANHRDAGDKNPADPPLVVNRSVVGSPLSDDNAILAATTYQDMRNELEDSHDLMHGFVRMGGRHISFRDPFVFLLHSNVDRLFARWQTDPSDMSHDRLNPALVYGSESTSLDVNIVPWSGGLNIRPWAAPENQQQPRSYKHPSIVFPPCYDTNGSAIPIVEVRNAGSPPVINFNDVPTGETAVRAAVFRVFGCGGVTVRVKSGAGAAAPFSTLQPLSGSITVQHGMALFADVRIWMAYTAGAAGVAVPDGTVTFECPENGKEFAFILKANAIARPRVAVMLALDQSWSMSFPAGTSGATRLQVLKEAGQKFMELIQQGNAVGLIRFDHDSYDVNDANFPGLAITDINSNSIFDPGRIAAVNAVSNHTANPAGNTSVGDGVDRARQKLNAIPPGTFQQKAIVVLTDGLENRPLSIADVAGSIDDRTFAIGLGNEQQVNTAALQALTNGTGGYLLLTGLLSSSIDDYFRLSKYFLQILAGVTNTDVILDPSGYLALGVKLRIPYYLTEADIDCTPLLMTDHNIINMMLETPDGTLIDPAQATGLGMAYGSGAQTKHYRYTLPVAIGAGQRNGTWHVVLEINKDEFLKKLSELRDKQGANIQSFFTHGARYNVSVQTYSNLRMSARVEQGSLVPGATMTFWASLKEYDLPVEKRAVLELELLKPNGSIVTVPMDESEPGTFIAHHTAIMSGVYHARIVAIGTTLRGTPFTREQLLTAAVWRGGDNPYVPPHDAGNTDWCHLLECLLGQKNISRELEERLNKEGVNLRAMRNCLKYVCSETKRLPNR